jgi:hypothetical protein
MNISRKLVTLIAAAAAIAATAAWAQSRPAAAQNPPPKPEPEWVLMTLAAQASYAGAGFSGQIAFQAFTSEERCSSALLALLKEYREHIKSLPEPRVKCVLR